MAALLTAVSLAGCATSGSEEAARRLPSPSTAGDLFRRVPHPPLREGDDARAVLLKTDAALAEANGRIVGALAWYEAIRLTYGDQR